MQSAGAGEIYARLRAAMSDLPDDSAVELLGDLDRLLDGEMALMHEVHRARGLDPVWQTRARDAAVTRLPLPARTQRSTAHV